VGRSSAVLLLHKGGYLVPTRMSLAASVTGEEWFAAAEEVRTHWSFLFFAGEDAGFRVTAACRPAASLLGLDLLAVRAGAVTLEHLLQRGVEDVLADLAVNADKLLFVALRAGAEGATVNVLARLQSLRLHGMEEAFHILRFRRATTLEEQAGLQGGLQAGPTSIAFAGGLLDSRLAVPAGAQAAASQDADEQDGHPQHSSSGVPRKGTWAAKSPHPAVGSGTGACPFFRPDETAPHMSANAEAAGSSGGIGSAKPRHVSFMGAATEGSASRPPRPMPRQESACRGSDAPVLLGSSLRTQAVVASPPTATAITETVQTTDSVPSELHAFFLQPQHTYNAATMAAGFAGTQTPSGQQDPRVGDAALAVTVGSILDLPSFIPEADVRTGAAGASVGSRASALATTDSNGAIEPPSRPCSAEEAVTTPSGDPAAAPLRNGRGAGSFSSLLLSRNNPGLRSPSSSGRIPTPTAASTASGKAGWGAGSESASDRTLVHPAASSAHAEQASSAVDGVAGALSIRAPGTAVRKARVAAVDGHVPVKRDSGVRLNVVRSEEEGEMEEAREAAGRRFDAPTMPARGGRYGTGGKPAVAIDHTHGGNAVVTAPTPNPASDMPLVAEPSGAAGVSSPVAGAQQGKAPSVHSRGSGASASSVSDLLRKGITAKGARLERSLVVLNRAIIIAFLVVAAMNIASLAVISNQIANLGDSLEMVGSTARRALSAQKITFGLLDLNLVRRGLLPQVTDNGTALKQYLLADAADFEVEHTALFARVSPAYPEEFALYTTPSVTTENPIQGQYVDMDHYNRTYENVSLMNAAAEFLTRARRIVNMPVASMTRADADVLYVIRNGMDAFRIGLNASIILADGRSATQAATIDLADQVVLAVALFIFCAIGTCVILPAVGAVLKARRAVFDVFLDVPVGVLRALRSRVQRRLEAEQKAEEGDDVGVDAELDDEAGGSPFSPQTPGPSGDDGCNHGGDRRASGADGTAPAPQSGLQAAVSASNSASGTGRAARTNRRRFQRSSSSSSLLIVAMVLPLLLYCAAYIGMFFWRRGVVEASRLAKNEVLYAAQLEFSVLQATIHVRTSAVESAPGFVAIQMAKGREQLDNAVRRLDWLAYGNSEAPRMAPMLQSGTPLATLLGGNACLSGYDRYYTESSCARFRDGILHSNGLLGGIRDFRTAALRILDTLAGDPTLIYSLTNGDGGLVHSYGSTYLRPALREFSAASRVLAQAQLQMLDTISIVVTVLLVVLLAVVYGLVYKPRVWNSPQ